MFNKSKKYCIIKGLPFVCFTNINATEAYYGFKSGDDNIKVVVDDVVYTLKSGIEINEDYNKNISVREIIVKGDNWKKNNESEYNQNLYDVIYKVVDKDYSLVSFKMNNDEYVKKNVIDNLKKKMYNHITSGLTLYFESVYVLNKDSCLNDFRKDSSVYNPDPINIEDTEILFSDLKDVTNIKELENFIKNKFKDIQFNDKSGYLVGKKISEINFDEFFIEGCLDDDGKLSDDKVKEIVDNIKENKLLSIYFRPYFNYTINDIKLSDNLAKTRKPKNDFIKKFINDKTDLLKKNIEKLNCNDINTKIKAIEGFENVVIDIQSKGNLVVGLDQGNVDLTITADPNNKFSEPMTGTIKFQIENDKNIQYVESFKGNEIPVTFGKPFKNEGGYVAIDTSIDQNVFKEQIKKYLGGIDAAEDKYSIDFGTKFGDHDTGTATDGFEVKVTFKGVVKNFTKNLEAGNKNVVVNFVIKDNNENKYKLVDGLSNSTKAFKGNLDYSGFINALETELNKGGELADAISEVSYNNASGNVKWTSAEPKNIGELGIKSVTITLKQNENGKYVVKAVSTPPAKDTVTFNLNVITNVNGYKVKAGSETLNVEVAKDVLTYSTLFNAIESQIGDDKFKIMKGSSAINNTDTIDITNTNAYSIELTEGSSLIEKVKNEDSKGNEDKKEEQTGDKPTEKKGCCGGKCYGGDKKNK